MAWVTQEFNHSFLTVTLHSCAVSIFQKEEEIDCLFLEPTTPGDAHAWAMMLRRAARRLEEIGKDLA